MFTEDEKAFDEMVKEKDWNTLPVQFRVGHVCARGSNVRAIAQTLREMGYGLVFQKMAPTKYEWLVDNDVVVMFQLWERSRRGSTLNVKQIHVRPSKRRRGLCEKVLVDLAAEFENATILRVESAVSYEMRSWCEKNRMTHEDIDESSFIKPLTPHPGSYRVKQEA